KDVAPFVCRLPDGFGPASGESPHRGLGSLLAKTHLVLQPHFDAFIRILILYRLDKKGALSSHFAAATGSFLGWYEAGRSGERPRRCINSYTALKAYFLPNSFSRIRRASGPRS